MIKILARPAFRSPNGESSSLLIAKTLNSNSNIEVYDWLSFFDVFKKKPDLIILHWPDNLLKNNLLKFLLKFEVLRLALTLSKHLFKTKIVWIGHNTKTHFYVSKSKENYYWKKFLDVVDYIIYPLPTILEMHDIPQFRGKKVIIPFGPYSNRKIDFKHLADLKETIGYEESCKYYLWFGLIRPYKNLEFLIETFDSLNTNVKLLIVGKVVDKEYYNNLHKSSKVIFIPKFIEDSEFPSFMDLASGCIFNYNKITNSGSIRMALSYNKPVFCNYFKQLGDFNNLLKTDLLKFYDNQADLKALIKRNKLETPSEVEWDNSSWSRFNELFINEVINI